MQDGMPSTDEALVRITGPETESHTVPVEVLARLLNGIQQTAYVLGASNSGISINRRFKPSEEIRRSNTLRCEIPRPGSYAVPVTAPFGQTRLLASLHELFEAVATGNRELLLRVIPDSTLRDRALLEMKKFFPKAGDRWGFGFGRSGVGEIHLEAKSVKTIERWFAQDEPQDAIMTVTGELIGIDFAGNKVTLRYAPTGREIICAYLPEIEDTILASRRDLIQVTGKFILDDLNNPKSLSDVMQIEAVDLSPMTFDRVEFGDRVFRLREPLTLTPTLDESEQYMELCDDTLDLFVYAQNREQLVDELAEQIAVLWDEYAQEDPANLSDTAVSLQERLLKAIEGVAHA